jgi:hypothetical protein
MRYPLRVLLWLAALVLLLGVFSLYLQPHFLFTLAQQVWSCF